MPRKIIIVGNGLGMAIDPNYFSLTNALNEIWNDPSILTDKHKELINRCTQSDNAPQSEDELDDLHLAITSCKTLKRIGSGEVDWLSEYGEEFPEITSKYIHKVATYLHNGKFDLPEEFSKPLIDFVKKTKSHIATLNYDKLLYSSFLENDIFNGYSGFLVDGMLDRGFDSKNMERLYQKDFGYYLHLHGSPLFVNCGSTIKKLSREDLTLEDLTLENSNIGRHIVLTHVKHKPEVIAASYVLRTYWDYLRFSLSESEEVILFGYSGLDKHLNNLIRPYLANKEVKVIECSDAGEQSIREAFWDSALGKNPTLIQLPDIKKFTDW
jgi:hypothetical protein